MNATQQRLLYVARDARDYLDRIAHGGPHTRDLHVLNRNLTDVIAAVERDLKREEERECLAQMFERR